MNERQFKEFELNHRMDIVNINGTYINMRSYDRYRINLYSIYEFQVEVWYDAIDNKITKVQVANKELLKKMYL